jgi:hypothetical protein
LTYVDDCLFFAKEQHQIDELLESIWTKSKLQFSIEDDAFTFLGVELKSHEDGTVEFLQKGLIEKILKHCNMTNCNTKTMPANQTPSLGTDADGPAFDRSFDYASIVGMMMYLSSNSRPDIQFAVHQCARFTHNPETVSWRCYSLHMSVSTRHERQGSMIQTNEWTKTCLLLWCWFCGFI